MGSKDSSSLPANGSQPSLCEASKTDAAPPRSKDEEAEKAKMEGNRFFKEQKYAAAVVWYTKAVTTDPSEPIYFANRAFAHIKLENYGSAISDASEAIALDPKYVKAYYRRGDAKFAMGKYQAALRDFRLAMKVSPTDPDLRKKLAACEKEVKRIRFEQALSSPDEVVVPVSETVDLSIYTVDSSYDGPHMAGSAEDGFSVTLNFITSMMEHFRDRKTIHKRFALEIILQAQALLKQLPALVDVAIPPGKEFTVCGDVHGQYYDLLNIFKLNGNPSPENPYLFNGDFVDRGSWSVEVILTLLAWKVLYPEHMFLARGNHESKAMNRIYGFDGEVKSKYNEVICDVFRETFCWLPLAHVLNSRVFCVHGGLFSRDDVTLDELRAIDRNCEPPDSGAMCEMLWSDPSPMPGRQPSKRGVGVAFGADVTKAFLQKNGLELIVRSHEVKDDGYEVEHDGYLATVFSAPNYCDSMGNKGAFVRFNSNDMVPHFRSFEAVEHPDVRPMAYASNIMGLFGL